MQALINQDKSGIWQHFAALNAVPRASKKEERVIEFMMNFGQSLGLPTIKDAVGNVIIKKPATAGREQAPTLIMQGHLDMVHQKNNDTDFDFDTQGINMYIDGDWVRAKGTTLGADNGLGVAAIMNILAAKDLPHPAIEALFTIDEETGMTGAKGLESGKLDGKILLNLDTEEDDEFTIGCAGGIDVTATKEYTAQAAQYANGYTLTVKGLCGGHSGMEIHKGLGNANKLMNRILYTLHTQHGIEISSINGGGLRNAIPRESVAVINVQGSIDEIFETVKKEITDEYSPIEPNITITLEANTAAAAQVLSLQDQDLLLKSIYAAHNGVYRMSPGFSDLVETSNNLARVLVENGKIQVMCLTRSSVESSKYTLVQQLQATFELMGATVSQSGDYPGWTPNPNSQVLTTMVANYKKIFGSEPHVGACHAGLECGIIAKAYPDLDMISFGPTILGAHSPDERASISSTEKFWKLLTETLATI